MNVPPVPTTHLALGRAGQPTEGGRAMNLGIVVLTVALAAIGYAVSVRVWPIVACSSCKGTGIRRNPLGASWRPCGRCRGTGNRKRGGR